MISAAKRNSASLQNRKMQPKRDFIYDKYSKKYTIIKDQTQIWTAKGNYSLSIDYRIVNKGGDIIGYAGIETLYHPNTASIYFGFNRDYRRRGLGENVAEYLIDQIFRDGIVDDFSSIEDCEKITGKIKSIKLEMDVSDEDSKEALSKIAQQNYFSVTRRTSESEVPSYTLTRAQYNQKIQSRQ